MERAEEYLLNEENLIKEAALEYSLDPPPPYYWRIRNISITDGECMVLEMVWLNPVNGDLIEYFEKGDKIECPDFE